MIKFAHFNISLKLKQKYLFEKLYFFKKIYRFYCVIVFHIQFIFNFPQEYLYPPVKMSLKGELISHYLISVTTESL